MIESIEKFENILTRDTRAFIEFQSKDEYLLAMVEDLSDWLNYLYGLKDGYILASNNFFEHLKNGVILCKHANLVQSLAEEYLKSSNSAGRKLPMKIGNQILQVPLQPPTFTVVDFTKTIFRYHGRDNVSNFISWCRSFNIPTSLTFETDDLVTLKNPRSVVVSLLELSKIGRLFGMEVPDIIQLDQEIDEEIIRNNNNVAEEGVDIVDNIEDNNYELENMIVSVDEGVSKTQENNSSLNDRDQEKSPKKLGLFGLRNRRSSANITRHDLLPQGDTETILLAKDTAYQMPASLDTGHLNPMIRKSQSVYFDIEDSSAINRLDNSDNESNFSQSSHSNFQIPKYRTARPVGRVKIYDNFDKSNYVKEKKTREKVDLRSLDERVREVLSLCTCVDLFMMKRIAEGRYQFGDKKSMIFVRILRMHVMVRVGGGWDTLGNFLHKHDPCRKGKIDDFKFYLPTQSKRPLSNSNETPITLQPNATCSGDQFDFSQGMVTLNDLKKSNSSDCCDGREHPKEEHEYIVEHKKLAQSLKEQKLEPERRTVNGVNGSGTAARLLRPQKSEAQNGPLMNAFKRYNNNNLGLPNKNLTAPCTESASRPRPERLTIKKEESEPALSLIHSPDTLRLKVHQMLTDLQDSALSSNSDKSSSKIPRFQPRRKK